MRREKKRRKKKKREGEKPEEILRAEHDDAHFLVDCPQAHLLHGKDSDIAGPQRWT